MARKRKHLDDVQHELAATKEKAKPIFQLLNLRVTDRGAKQMLLATVNQLPVPLFILYHQAVALKEAFNANFELSVEGKSLLSPLFQVLLHQVHPCAM